MLVAKGLVIIGGRRFEITDEKGEHPGLPISASAAHRDTKSSSAELVVWDVDNVTGEPFPIFNSMPDPMIEHNVPYDMWLGWEGEALVKVFEGILLAKEVNTQTTETTLIGVHDSYRMKKRGKVRARTHITIADLLRQLGLEYGIEIRFIGSAASDPALTVPRRWTIQGVPGVESNWAMMCHYLYEYGFILNTTLRGVVEIRKDKDADPQFDFTYGDEWGLQFNARFEQRRDHRTSRIKGYSHEAKPGKRAQYEQVEPEDGGRRVQAVPPATAKRDQTPHRSPMTKLHVRNTSRRLKHVEGHDASMTCRMRPQLKNTEQYTLNKYGPQLSGLWHAASVEHSIGKGTASTRLSVWKIR